MNWFPYFEQEKSWFERKNAQEDPIFSPCGAHPGTLTHILHYAFCDTGCRTYITLTISLRLLLIFWSSVALNAKCQMRGKQSECLEKKSRMFSWHASSDKMGKVTLKEGCLVLHSYYITQCLRNPLLNSVEQCQTGFFSLQQILLQLACCTFSPRGIRSTGNLCRCPRLKELCHGTFAVSGKSYTEILFLTFNRVENIALKLGLRHQ